MTSEAVGTAEVAAEDLTEGCVIDGWLELRHGEDEVGEINVALEVKMRDLHVIRQKR